MGSLKINWAIQFLHQFQDLHYSYRYVVTIETLQLHLIVKKEYFFFCFHCSQKIIHQQSIQNNLSLSDTFLLHSEKYNRPLSSSWNEKFSNVTPPKAVTLVTVSERVQKRLSDLLFEKIADTTFCSLKYISISSINNKEFFKHLSTILSITQSSQSIPLL